MLWRLLRTNLRDLLVAPLWRQTPENVDRNIAIAEKAVELARDLRWHGPDFRRAVLSEAASLLDLTPVGAVDLLGSPTALLESLRPPNA